MPCQASNMPGRPARGRPCAAIAGQPVGALPSAWVTAMTGILSPRRRTLAVGFSSSFGAALRRRCWRLSGGRSHPREHRRDRRAIGEVAKRGLDSNLRGGFARNGSSPATSPSVTNSATPSRSNASAMHLQCRMQRRSPARACPASPSCELWSRSPLKAANPTTLPTTATGNILSGDAEQSTDSAAVYSFQTEPAQSTKQAYPRSLP